MTFVFKIEDAIEVHRDPGGHYHHWTILVGTLCEGTMHLRDRIAIPSINGALMVATIGGFEAFRRTLGNQITAIEINETIGVMTWYPALKPTDIQRGVATACPLAMYQTIILEMLQRDPELLLHCHDCRTPLRGIPEAVPYLQQILAHPEADLAHRASKMLEWLLLSRDSHIKRDRS